MQANGSPEIHPDFRQMVREAEDRAAARALEHPSDSSLSIAELRKSYRDLQPPAPEFEVGSIRNEWIPGHENEIQIRLYEEDVVPKKTPLIVYFHGGGYVLGDLDTHDAVCRALCVYTGYTVASVEYRLAPEHKFPAQQHDCYAAVKWIAERGVEIGLLVDGIVVAGDSAGGALATCCCMMARDEGGPDIDFQLLLVPGVDTDQSRDSYTRRSNAMLNANFIDFFTSQCVANPIDALHPYYRPLHAENHSNLPPALVMVAECDILYDEGVAYAEKLKEAGVEAELIVADGMIHHFSSLPHISTAASSYLKIAAELVIDAVAASQLNRSALESP